MLKLRADVFAGRVDAMHPHVLFDAVILRAVDRMIGACHDAVGRVKAGGWLVVMLTEASVQPVMVNVSKIDWMAPVALRGSAHGVVLMGRRRPEL